MPVYRVITTSAVYIVQDRSDIVFAANRNANVYAAASIGPCRALRMALLWYMKTMGQVYRDAQPGAW